MSSRSTTRLERSPSIAAGREAGEDPYYTHAYRVSLDTGTMKLLNPGDASHAVSASDSGRYFVDVSSRVNTAPKSVLLDAAGTPVAELETMDVSAAVDAGYQFPEPFKVKADDGITDLYGVMYKPFDFDPAKKYPIIAFVYPGPQTESVTKTFSKSQNIALAQFGFIVMEVGNRGGNPNRSKWYHTYGYGNLRDYGLADKKAAIEQLARRFPYIDIDRVGIWGHSGGGFMTAAAMLVYPDFFKAGFSESGNHENNIYNNTWSEKHHGIKEVADQDGTVKFEYSIEKNSELAKNLKGHLMLVTGDIDDNVHPANTYRLANALIKANKRFEFFVLPGLRHSFQPAQDYVFWLRSDFFNRHLLGKAPDSVDMLELNREKEQSGDKKPRRTGTSPQQDRSDRSRDTKCSRALREDPPLFTFVRLRLMAARVSAEGPPYFLAASVFGGSVQIFFGAGPGSAFTVCVIVPMPSIDATILSPGFSQICSGRTLRDIPVPAGLPDAMTSPGNMVRIDVLYSIRS